MPFRRHTTALFLLLCTTGAAQTHHVAPPEKVTRAVAVYEWTGELAKPTASRLVPVSLFINGHFEDAGLYLARPVPLALDSGNLYSIDEAGNEKGTLAIQKAADFTAGRLLADVDPEGTWYGFGNFTPLGPPKPGPVLKPSAHLPVIVSSSDSGKPHLESKPDSSTDGKTPMGSDPDRPTLERKPASSTGDSTDASATADSTADSKSKPDDLDRPSLRKRSAENTGRRTPPQAGVTGPDRSLNDDPDRPVIRHGKTPEEQDAAELKTLPAGMHQTAAVSDPARREPHLFARAWESAAERADVLARLQALARTQTSAYLATNHLMPGQAPPAAVASTSAAAGTPAATANTAADASAPRLRRTPNGVNTSTTPSAALSSARPAPPAKTPSARTMSRTRRAPSLKTAVGAPLSLTDEQLHGYLLSYGGLPTFVYTAEVPVTTGGPVYVAVVAQRLPSGELQVALRSTTDAGHLDRAPWLRFVDAVDPDASHRASLLFELRSHDSRQFALYRLISAEAEQEFVSAPIQ